MLLEAATYFCLSSDSATSSQMDSNKVPNFKLKPILCNYVKTEKIKATAPPQQLFQTGHNFLGHSVVFNDESGKYSFVIKSHRRSHCKIM